MLLGRIAIFNLTKGGIHIVKEKSLFEIQK